MSTNHKGNTQPAIDQEEHTHIGGVAGKKVFNIDSSGNVLSFTEIGIKATDSPSIDAFGRLRVSEPQTIFDSKQLYDKQPLFWDDQEVSGGSTTSTHSTDTVSTTMGVANTTAGRRVRQTFMRFNYQPGKSQLIFLTGVLDKSGGGTGISRCFGVYDDNNGLFLLDEDGTVKIVRRTSVTGSAVDNKVSQSSWNIDTMDGSGTSGITLDFTKTQILIIDYEWLGVGRARIGFVVDGAIHYAHQFLNTNVLDEVYMSTPNLPLRYEIENDGTGAASTLQHICASVISEGGSEETGTIRSVSTGGTHIDINTENQLYALIGIRLKAAALSATIKLIKAELQIQTTSELIEWQVLANPTVADTFTYSNQTNSVVQTAIGATANTVSGGTFLAGGYGESGGTQGGKSGSTRQGPSNAIALGSAIDGTPDEFVLCAQPIGGSTNVDIEAMLTWRELS